MGHGRAAEGWGAVGGWPASGETGRGGASRRTAHSLRSPPSPAFPRFRVLPMRLFTA